MTNIQMPS